MAQSSLSHEQLQQQTARGRSLMRQLLRGERKSKRRQLVAVFSIFTKFVKLQRIRVRGSASCVCVCVCVCGWVVGTPCTSLFF